jgi:hypothetical protein
MANLKLDDIFELALVSKRCWICFTDSPNLESIQEARKLLDRLTDDLVRDQLKGN